MDTRFTLIGFLVGITTSATGEYFAEKYIDHLSMCNSTDFPFSLVQQQNVSNT